MSIRRGQKLFFSLLFLCLIAIQSVSADDLKDFCTAGEQSYQKGDYANAIKSYEKALDIDPDFAPAYNALALVYHRMNAELKDVIWLFKVAVDIDPQYAQAYTNMCRVYYQAGLHDEAESACRKALEINPNLASAQLALAWVYLAGKSQPQQAVPYFKQVLTRIDSPQIYFGLGLAYSMSGQRPQVLEVVTDLRSKGEDRLAAQLEETLRGPLLPSTVRQQFNWASLPERQPGQIISAAPPAPELPETPPGGATGTVRVRLRGQMTSTASPESVAHPGSISTDSSPKTSDGSVQHYGGTSAIERIRRLQRLRQGIGGGTSIPEGY